MIKRTFFTAALAAVALAASASAQNTNTNTGTAGGRRQTRTTTGAAARPAQAEAGAQTEPATPARTPRSAAKPAAAGAQAAAVREAFDSLVAGIRRADADAVMQLYWDSPQLVVFNNNGTVTRGFAQVKENRESLYAKVSDVKLDVRDVRVKTLGPAAAVVTCLWEQSQTADGQPERATGRLTIVYQKVGTAWKIVHTHTSPDKPSPSNLFPSERTTPAPEPTPARTPAKP
ncbi:MAG TPA: SgcJ/EcaC family oxidoreductase [Pyrinomonadaceae bacterium]|jgi:uncharacterized protein (TIGR02246 family)